MSEEKNQENLKRANFTKEEIEEAGGFVKVKDNGELDIFIPKKLLYTKVNISNINNKKNNEPENEDEEDWGEKSL